MLRQFIQVFIFGVFPKWILDPLGIDASFIRVFTVMRALRLARLARAVRLKPAFKDWWFLLNDDITVFTPFFIFYISNKNHPQRPKISGFSRVKYDSI